VTTLIHERVEAARAGTNPTVICRMPSGEINLAKNRLAASADRQEMPTLHSRE
jgi:hypothetical protein